MSCSFISDIIASECERNERLYIKAKIHVGQERKVDVLHY
jgi:hypothetical protein